MTGPCQHSDKIARYELFLERFNSMRHSTFEWLVISAAIAILVLAFHMGRAIVKIEAETSFLLEQTRLQTTILENIHQAIHEEGHRNVLSHAGCISSQKGKK